MKRIRLAQRRRAVGLSQEALAEQLGVDSSTVRRWERGDNDPQPWHRPRLAKALKVTVEQLAELLEAAPEDAALSPAHLVTEDDRIERVLNGRMRVDAAIINHFASLLNEQRRLEDAIGGQPLLASVLRQMETVQSLVFSARGTLVEVVLALVASHTQFIAWMYQDSGNSLRAIEYYSLTHDLAVEAGDADMRATALSMRAHVAWSAAEPLRCQRFGEVAAETPGASPMVRGMAVQMAARGLAMQGDAQARQVLDRAAVLLARVTDMPEWMYFYGDVWLTLQTGMIESHLHHWERAAAMYRDGLARLPEHFARDRAWYLSCLAVVEAEKGDGEAALEVARLALPKAIEVRNRHGVRQIARAASRLGDQGAPGSHELREMLGHTMSS